MRGFWDLWDNHGVNWIFFLFAFLLIEGVAIFTHHRTLSESFWAAYEAHQDVMIFILFLGIFVLVGHFLGFWWR